MPHITFSPNFNPLQSAYCRRHSTETTFTTHVWTLRYGTELDPLYLNDRNSFIRWGSGQSATTGNKIWVPQGSSMGPLLFSLYIAPLAKVTQSFGAHTINTPIRTFTFSPTKRSGPLESTQSSKVQIRCTTGYRTTASRSTYPSPKLSSLALRGLDLRRISRVSTLLVQA